MSKGDPLSLLNLAARGLLSDEDAVVRALEELPVDLFPALFTPAFAGRQAKIVKALVQAWPFPCLRLGSLMELSKTMLDAVLDGLEFVPADTACPRKSKLQVLDFTHDHMFSDWEDCYLTRSAHFLLSQTPKDPEADGHTPSLREELQHDGEPVQIHADLHLNFMDFIHVPGCSFYLLQRVERSRGRLCLHCRVLEIVQVPLCTLVEIPRWLTLDSIRMVRLVPSVEINTRSDLAPFFSQVGQMRNLNIFMMWGPDWEFPLDCFSLLSPLSHFKKLFLKFSNISGRLSKLLRSLQKPLETLVVNGCRLTENDITYLTQSVHSTSLKELDICNNDFSGMVPMPLEGLLSQVSGTLEHLNMSTCNLKESQLKALLPALCSCSQLHSLIFGDNVISTSGVTNMLEQLAGLRHLAFVEYPAPTECLNYWDEASWRNFNSRVNANLQKMLQGLNRDDITLTNPTM